MSRKVFDFKMAKKKKIKKKESNKDGKKKGKETCS